MMKIPGVNLLRYASRVIKMTNVAYYKALPRETNTVGQYVPEYDNPLTIKGSLQPVPKSLYEQLGLDLQRSYYNYYTTTDVTDVQRDITSDKFVYNGNTFKVISSTDWLSLDGWKSILAVLVTNDG